MRAFRELRVVTPARWLATDLAAGARGCLTVAHDLGFDSPRDVTGTAWWMPHQHAERLTLTHPGLSLALTSPGPRWLAELDRRWTGRTVWAGRLGDLALCRLWDFGAAFAKPAEIKLGALTASAWATREAFEDAAVAAGLLPESWVVVSEPTTFTAEFRCFVAPGADGQPCVIACSPYVVDGRTWDSWSHLKDAPPVADATAFAAEVLACSSAAGPSGWVLDVGFGPNGWQVVEANAAWSANPYHCDARGVVAAVLAAQDDSSDERWAWRSDPMLARRARPLVWA